MLKIIQQIIGLGIVAVGLKLWHSGGRWSVPLSVIVFGILVMLNAGRKKKEEDEGW